MEQNVAFTFGKGVTNLYRTLKRNRPDILIPSTDNDDDYISVLIIALLLN